MADSVDVKLINLNRIRREIYKVEECTKQSIVAKTGLSAATCNTLLNELENNGEIIGEKKKLNNVGRFTSVYRVNEGKELFLCIMLQLVDGEKLICYDVVSVTGKMMDFTEESRELVTLEDIVEKSKEFIKKYPQIIQIMVGIPGNISGSAVGVCDISELDGTDIGSALKEQLNLPVYVENDVAYRAYGYYCKHYRTEGVFSFGVFPEFARPGLMSVYTGKIIRGTNGFAGFLGYYKNFEDSYFNEDNAENLMFVCIAANIVMVNPDRIVLTGKLVTQELIEKVLSRCKEETDIPPEYLPEIVYEPDIWAYYVDGMIEKAIDLKEIAI